MWQEMSLRTPDPLSAFPGKGLGTRLVQFSTLRMTQEIAFSDADWTPRPQVYSKSVNQVVEWRIHSHPLLVHSELCDSEAEVIHRASEYNQVISNYAKIL